MRKIISLKPNLNKLKSNLVENKISDPWTSIGTILGQTSIDDYSFHLKKFKAKKGDIVAAEAKQPTGDGRVIDVIVWGRIMEIISCNEFLPNEAAKELTEGNIDIQDTILPLTKNDAICTVKNLGYTTNDPSKKLSLMPLNYPVYPGGAVKYPASKDLESLLNTDMKGRNPIFIGNLVARKDVDVQVSADNMVSRHVLVIGMTGSGKSVWVRRAVRELMTKQYPILIIDPHGDNLGIVQKAKKLFPDHKIKLFYPKISASENNKEVIYTLIERLGNKLTEPQYDFLNWVLTKTDYETGTSLIQYISILIQKSNKAAENKRNKSTKSSDGPGNTGASTMGVVSRSLRKVYAKLNEMEQSNTSNRNKYPHLKFEELPDPYSQPEKIIQKSQVSILYLKGYESLPSSTIVSILLESLFNHRSAGNRTIPPFFTVLEEAQNFIPSKSEGQDGYPSVSTIKKIATEGRKFGTGLMLVSQRPYRLDETVCAQMNSYIILRLKNERDQRFVKNTMENWDNEEAKQLPNFANGQGIVSGQITNLPLTVQIKFDDDLTNEDIGDENFIADVQNWKETPENKKKREFSKDFDEVFDVDKRKPH
tara:strand:- start:1459 stop:3237 length:1779 start_codon:yes stop_codon:yes gene_type:complete